jgi:hypothetical protein
LVAALLKAASYMDIAKALASQTCSRCNHPKPEGRVHRWCASCLREYKDQRCFARSIGRCSATALRSSACEDTDLSDSGLADSDRNQRCFELPCVAPSEDCEAFATVTPMPAANAQCPSGPRGRQRYPCHKDRGLSELNGAGAGAQETCAEGRDLYVMRNSRIAGELKIGKSYDAEERRCSLERSQNFRTLLVATFSHAGHIEGYVHRILSYCRVPKEEAAGKEWFRCSLQTAFAAIGVALGQAPGT